MLHVTPLHTHNFTLETKLNLPPSCFQRYLFWFLKLIADSIGRDECRAQHKRENELRMVALFKITEHI